MSRTVKSLIYKKRDGHKHVFNLEEERIEDMFNYYLSCEEDGDN